MNIDDDCKDAVRNVCRLFKTRHKTKLTRWVVRFTRSIMNIFPFMIKNSTNVTQIACCNVIGVTFMEICNHFLKLSKEREFDKQLLL